MDQDGILYQYDVSNKKELESINISSRIPLKKADILDVCFNPTNFSLYTLNQNWVLEVWSLHQNISVPIASMKVLSEQVEDADAIKKAYTKRHKNRFPNFLTLSEPQSQVLAINCSFINNSIILVDPSSLSIVNTIYISKSNFKMNQTVSKMIYKLTPALKKASSMKGKRVKKGKGAFDRIFGGCIVQNRNF